MEPTDDAVKVAQDDDPYGEYASTNAGPEDVGAETWYANLQEKAKGVNHTVFVSVMPGEVQTGQLVTMKPMPSYGGPLEDSLREIDAYLASDEAQKRGNLYRAREDAEKQLIEARAALIAAQLRAAAARADVENDTDAALEEEMVDVEIDLTPEQDQEPP